MWDLNSPNQGLNLQRPPPCKGSILTIGPPGKSYTSFLVTPTLDKNKVFSGFPSSWNSVWKLPFHPNSSHLELVSLSATSLQTWTLSIFKKIFFLSFYF